MPVIFCDFHEDYSLFKLCRDARRGGGHSIVKNTGGGWLDSLGSGILVGKRYLGVLQKY